MVVKQNEYGLIFTTNNRDDFVIYKIYSFRCGAVSNRYDSGRHGHSNDSVKYNNLFKKLNLE